MASTNRLEEYTDTEGTELKLVENRLRDMEFRDGWEQLVSFVHSAGFGVSRPAAGMVETSSYSVLFATLTT
jgi:hypothetical protein